MPAHDSRRSATIALADRHGRNVARDAEPNDQLLHVIWRERTKVDKLDKILGSLAERAGIDPTGSGLRSGDPAWAAAIPATRPTYELQQAEEKLLASHCIQYVRLGFESREIVLKEQMADMFLFVISRALEQLELTPRQQRAAPRIIEDCVLSLEARNES